MSPARGNRIVITHVRLDDLDAGTRDATFDHLTALVGSSLTPDVAADESWAVADWTGRRDEICERASVYVARVGKDVVGFLAYEPEVLLDRHVITLIAGCIRPEWQSRGIAFAFNVRLLLRTWRRSRLQPTFLVARILNPKALHGWRRQLDDQRYFWPRIGDAPEPVAELAAIVTAYRQRHEPGVEFDPAGSVLKRRHLPGPRSTSPSGDLDVDQHYDKYADLESGDTVLMAIYLTRSLIASHLGRLVASLPRAVFIRPGRPTE